MRVHGWREAGMPLREALRKGMDLVPAGLQSGLIGVTRDGGEVVARRPLAQVVRSVSA